MNARRVVRWFLSSALMLVTGCPGDDRLSVPPVPPPVQGKTRIQSARYASEQMLQWCLSRQNQMRERLSASAKELAGDAPEPGAPSSSPSRNFLTRTQIREDLSAFSLPERDCVMCQDLAACATDSTHSIGDMPLPERVQAIDLALSTLALAGWEGGEELPAPLPDGLPPEDGPTLARLLSIMCQSCRAGVDEASQRQEAELQTACLELFEARRRAWARLHRERYDCKPGEAPPPRKVHGLEVNRLPCPDLPSDAGLSPLDACAALEACAVGFIQARFNRGLDPVDPATWARERMARVVEDLCPAALARAAAAFDRWHADGAPPESWDPTAGCDVQAPRLGPALRRACGGAWK